MNKLTSFFIGFVLAGCALVAQPTQLTLEQAQQYAIDNSPNIKAADLQIKKAEEQVWETTSTGLPQINGSVNYNYFIKQPVSLLPAAAFDPFSQLRQLENYYNLDQFQTQDLPPQPDGFVPLVFGTKQDMSIGASLSQLLFSGSYIVGLQSAKAFKKISELSKEKAETEIKEIVANAYAAVLVADENIKILEKNLTVNQKNLNDIKAIYKEGLTEEQNVDQIAFSNNQLKTSVNFAKRQKQISLNSLKYIIGIDQSADMQLITSLTDLMTESLLGQETTNNITEHIDYRLLSNQVNTSELQVKFQQAQALPTLSAVLSSSYNAFSDDFTFFNTNQEWFNQTLVGVSLQIPVFSSFGRKAKTEQAKIDLEIAKLQLQNTKQQLIQNLNNAKLEYQNALDNYDTAKELIHLSEKIFKKEQIKFFEGLSTSNDLSAAENQLYQSENQYIQAIFQVIQAKNNLTQAIGNF